MAWWWPWPCPPPCMQAGRTGAVQVYSLIQAYGCQAFASRAPCTSSDPALMTTQLPHLLAHPPHTDNQGRSRERWKRPHEPAGYNYNSLMLPPPLHAGVGHDILMLARLTLVPFVQSTMTAFLSAAGTHRYLLDTHQTPPLYEPSQARPSHR